MGKAIDKEVREGLEGFVELVEQFGGHFLADPDYTDEIQENYYLSCLELEKDGRMERIGPRGRLIEFRLRR